MSDRLSRLVADWLAHRTGIVQAIVTTAFWFAAPEVFHWSFQSAVFWYLAYCTFLSYATQFTLAYQNRKAEIANELQLRNQMDLMNLVVAIAKENRSRMMEVQDEVEEIADALDDTSHPGRHSVAVDEKEVG